MARKRDYAAEYARRVAGVPRGERQAARGHKLPAGVRSEYQKRVAGTAPGSEARAAAAGSATRSSSPRWRARAGEGSLVGIDPGRSERNADGTWRVVYVTVLGADGTERTFRLAGRQLDDDKIKDLAQMIHDAGAIDSPLYPVRPEDDEEPDDLEADDLEDEDDDGGYMGETEAEEFDRIFGPAA